MNRLILAFTLLAFGSLSFADGGARSYYQQKARYAAWVYACEYTKYSCVGVEVPEVIVRSDMRRGLYGTYVGGNVVYIRQDLIGTRLKVVLMHEMVHYLQATVGGIPIPGPAFQICRAEEEAFTAVDDWLTYINATWLVVGPYWWESYPFCGRWYDPDWKPQGIWEQIMGLDK